MKRDTFGKLSRQTSSFNCYKQGKWTYQQYSIFNKAFKKYGRNWHKIALELKTRTPSQISSHAQNQSLKKNMNQHQIKQNSDKINTRSRLSAKKMIYNHKRMTWIQRQQYDQRNERQKSLKNKKIKKDEKKQGVKERMTRKVPLIPTSKQIKPQIKDKSLEPIVLSTNKSSQAKLRDQDSAQEQYYGGCIIQTISKDIASQQLFRLKPKITNFQDIKNVTKKQHSKKDLTNLRKKNSLVLSSFQRFRPIQKAQNKKQQQNEFNYRNMRQTKELLNLDYSHTCSQLPLQNILQAQNNFFQQIHRKKPNITVKKKTKKILKTFKQNKKTNCKNAIKDSQLEVTLEYIDQDSVQKSKPKSMELKKSSLLCSPVVSPKMIVKQQVPQIIERTFSFRLYNCHENQEAKIESIIQV